MNKTKSNKNSILYILALLISLALIIVLGIILFNGSDTNANTKIERQTTPDNASPILGEFPANDASLALVLDLYEDTEAAFSELEVLVNEVAAANCSDSQSKFDSWNKRFRTKAAEVRFSDYQKEIDSQLALIKNWSPAKAESNAGEAQRWNFASHYLDLNRSGLANTFHLSASQYLDSCSSITS